MAEAIQIRTFWVQVGDGEVRFRFEEGAQHMPHDEAGLESALGRCIAADPEAFRSRRIVIDLANMKALSSSQLGALITVRKAFGDDHNIQLANLQPNVREALRITHLADLFDL